MPDIQIQRQHALGLPLAREIARRWTGKLESDFSLRCRYEEGSQDDQVAVSGLGVAGWVVVNARFLKVQLDLRFPLIAVRSMIERRIAQELDRELDEQAALHPAAPDAPVDDAVAKPAAKKAAKPAAKKALAKPRAGAKSPAKKSAKAAAKPAAKTAAKTVAKNAAKSAVQSARTGAAPATRKSAARAPRVREA